MRLINQFNQNMTQSLTIDTLEERVMYSMIPIVEPQCTSGVCDVICDEICDVICDRICDAICDAICDKICDVFCDQVYHCDINFVCDAFCDRIVWENTGEL